MNVTISHINSNLPRTTWGHRVNKDNTTVRRSQSITFLAVQLRNQQVYFSVAAIISTAFMQTLPSWNFHSIWKHLSTFLSTPTKLATFLYLGQAPLRYSGCLDHFPLKKVTGVAGFGGIGLSILYLFHDRFKTNSLAVGGEHDSHSQEIKLDRALQEKVTFLLVCEIYHTVIGVVIGVLTMRICKLCLIDHKHLDLLMTAGLFGPMIFFALFISLTGVVFGISWCLQRSRHWWVMPH